MRNRSTLSRSARLAHSALRQAAITLAVMIAAVLASVATATPAQAVDVNNYCFIGTPNGDMCYWFRSNWGGAKAGLWQANADLLNPLVLFPGPGSGVGQPIGNHAGSGANYDTGCRPTIWYHASYTGSSLTLAKYTQPGWSSATLGVVNNNNRSQSWACG